MGLGLGLSFAQTIAKSPQPALAERDESAISIFCLESRNDRRHATGRRTTYVGCPLMVKGGLCL